MQKEEKDVKTAPAAKKKKKMKKKKQTQESTSSSSGDSPVCSARKRRKVQGALEGFRKEAEEKSLELLHSWFPRKVVELSKVL